MNPRFFMNILEESGVRAALYGISLSYRTPEPTRNDVDFVSGYINLDEQKAMKVAHKLADRDGGHNKFLESIQVSLLIKAARYWWQEFDTYRVGVTKSSESSMHTLTRMDLTQGHFAYDIPPLYLHHLNNTLTPDLSLPQKKLALKNALPEGFLQERMVMTNYKTLRHICNQRKNHELPEWQMFIKCLKGLSQSAWLGLESE